MAAVPSSDGVVRLLNNWANYDMPPQGGKHNISAYTTLTRGRRTRMPKLKREGDETRATDFVESLDRGLRLLKAFGNTTGPLTLSDVARAASCSRWSTAASSPATANCSR
jgi:hypothetical protein